MARNTTSILTILEQLCMHGKDNLVEALRARGALRSARLAFKALREAVDGSVTSLKLRVESVDLLERGQFFPLWRWPRLATIHVTTAPGVAENYVLCLVSPFFGQPPDCLLRITDIELEDGLYLTGTQLGVDATGTLAAAIRSMVNLRSLKLGLPLSEAPPSKQLLSDALASLSHLESLVLAQSCTLSRAVGLLGHRLQHLRLKDRYNNSDTRGVAWLASAAPQMRALQTVNINVNAFDDEAFDALAAFLCNPPPSLQTLSLSTFGPCEWTFTLMHGHVTEARLDTFAEVWEAAEFTRRLLAPLRPRLRRLQLSDIRIPSNERFREEEDLQQLRDVARHLEPGAFQLDQFTIWPNCSAERVMRAIGLLGLVPKTMRFGYRKRDVEDEEDDEYGEDDVEDVSVKAEQQRPAVTLPNLDWPSMHGPQLVSIVLELLLRLLGAEEAVAEAAAPGGPAAALAPGDNSAGHKYEPIVRIQSPLVASLASVPGALRSWLVALVKQMAAALPPATGSGQQCWWQVEDFVLVPSVGAVLLRCRTAEGAAAMAAAARAALAAGGLGYYDAVQVYSRLPRTDYFWRTQLSRAVQTLWDSGAGGSPAERLRLLVEMGCGLAKMQPVEALWVEDGNDD
ncbi:hypothetical protein PLESTB_000359000 [Pleodorina starrii]|uniref:Uncharacterized protein n=1 Tax=Pleodorina starrii TaxID=330485 RepID=A0A9W6EZL8_9CHLO|nr:hypothetical protein PLESTM_000036400 [Pleodorina starrii]GLC50251.1 hypothetical protein PLESTB_000359000 [Pleodorina starrii]GLC64367.1 hypothetical protein PLESTF_000153700 [Pleodorina starrii]